jgi:hypothetical protein
MIEKTVLKIDKFWKWSDTFDKNFDAILRWISDGNKFSLDGSNGFIEFIEDKGNFPNVASRTDEDWRRFRGDYFEVFAEMFYNIFFADPRYGLTEYTPIESSKDYGIDAVAKDTAGKRCVVQVKYRSNPLDPIVMEDVAKTIAQGATSGMYDATQPRSVIVFTTSNKLSVEVDRAYPGKVDFVSRDIIASIVFNNKVFWESCSKIIKNTIASKAATLP